jgi:hypothetical protein
LSFPPHFHFIRLSYLNRPDGTVPSSDGGAVGVTTDIEAIKSLIQAAQTLLTDALSALTGVASGGSPLETIGALTDVIKVS